jgi:serine/threonine protein kinase/tetratricopeptide (TPR) repeat protein
MAAAWQHGQGPPAEEFLTRHPELGDHPEAAVRLIYEEVCLRREAGQPVATAEVVQRFPQWQAELEVLFDCARFLQPHAAAPVFPKAGDILGDFHLLAELDRGARGRVFLASQPSLADRPLVLKFTPGEGQEHLTLARLQHTHIVPLYFVQEFPDRNLQVLCMPYLGGTTLARLLQALQGLALEQRTGQHLLDALDQAQAALPLSLPARGPARKFLARASYAEAMGWIGACLADALHDAHERGLVHLDLKPSNVLLTADGTPMLLDFHLAREPLQPHEPAPGWLGGTPVYMSPEQELGLAAVREGRPLPSAIDARSDLYSLGLVLYEALGGPLPVDLRTGPRLRRHNRHVSVGLADLVHKCLARDPGARYPTAAALVADLRRHLTGQPLRGVPNRSLRERWRKWRGRQPHLLPVIGMLLAALLVVVLAVRTAGTRVRTSNEQRLRAADSAARAALADGQEQLRKHRYAEAVRTLTRGLARAKGLPEGQDLVQALNSQLRQARRAADAQDLHALVERLRFLHGVDSPASDQLPALAARCRAAWEGRERFLQPGGVELAPDRDEHLRTDLFDLAVLWAELRTRLAPPEEMTAARREALQVLAEAEAVFGPSRVLYQERQVHAEALGLTELAQEAARRAAALAPRTAWEHYALGRFLLRAGDLEQAAAEFEQALELRPQDFWPHFYQGICAYRRRQYDTAVQAFHVCVALAPDCAECSYNRALAWAALGQTDRAVRDYSRALRLNPALVEAAVNRGVLYFQEKRYPEAITDFRHALNHGGNSAVIHYNLALIYLEQKDQASARASLRRALECDPGHQEARDLHESLSGKR